MMHAFDKRMQFFLLECAYIIDTDWIHYFPIGFTKFSLEFTNTNPKKNHLFIGSIIVTLFITATYPLLLSSIIPLSWNFKTQDIIFFFSFVSR